MVLFIPALCRSTIVSRTSLDSSLVWAMVESLESDWLIVSVDRCINVQNQQGIRYFFPPLYANNQAIVTFVSHCSKSVMPFVSMIIYIYIYIYICVCVWYTVCLVPYINVVQYKVQGKLHPEMIIFRVSGLLKLLTVMMSNNNSETLANITNYHNKFKR